jgi:Subtilisin inhibitor-like
VGHRKHLPGMKKGAARPAITYRAVQRLVPLGLPVLLLLVGCANQIVQTSDPTPGTTTMPETPSPSTPGEVSTATPAERATAAEPGSTDLTIVVRDGSGKTSTWRLTCDPAGGTHPDPKSACRVLEANGAAALPAVPKDKVCAQIYGGPETASITGTWQGNKIISQFARNDGCQISRWKLLEGLLPPGGS